MGVLANEKISNFRHLNGTFSVKFGYFPLNSGGFMGSFGPSNYGGLRIFYGWLATLCMDNHKNTVYMSLIRNGLGKDRIR